MNMTATEALNAAAAAADYNGPELEILAAEFPAFAVVRRSRRFGKPARLVAGEALALLVDNKRHGTLVHKFKINSVVSYALASGDCPIAAVDSERAKGHPLHWINASGASITAERRAQEKLILVEVGMLVTFEGRTFEIVSEANMNLGLREVTEGSN